MIGGAIRLGFRLREDLALQLRYSLYSSEITNAGASYLQLLSPPFAIPTPSW